MRFERAVVVFRRGSSIIFDLLAEILVYAYSFPPSFFRHFSMNLGAFATLSSFFMLVFRHVFAAAPLSFYLFRCFSLELVLFFFLVLGPRWPFLVSFSLGVHVFVSYF